MSVTNDALNIQQTAANNAITNLQNTYNETRTDLQPYRDMGSVGLVGMGNYNSSLSGINPNLNVNTGSALNPNLNVNPYMNVDPNINMNANITTDYSAIQNDPLYQFAQGEAGKAANQSLAAQGMRNSRYGVNTLANTAMNTALAARDRIYSQDVDNWNRAYGLASDNYNRNLALQENNYNRAYGQAADNYSRAYGQENDQFSRNYGIETDNYNRALNQLNLGNQNYLTLASLGQNAATNMANAGSEYASAYGDVLTGVANAQAAGLLSSSAFNQQQDAAENGAWMNLAGQIGSSLINGYFNS